VQAPDSTGGIGDHLPAATSQRYPASFRILPRWRNLSARICVRRNATVSRVSPASTGYTAFAAVACRKPVLLLQAVSP